MDQCLEADQSVRYVVTASAPLLERPDAQSLRQARLPIATALEVACRRKEWLQVSAPRFAGLSGWISQAQTDEARPSFAHLMRQYERSHDKQQRKSLAEAASSLEPLDAHAASAVLESLHDLGELESARQAEARLAQLLEPRVWQLKGEARTIMILNGKLMSPLANLTEDGQLLPFGGNLSALFSSARAYFAYARGGFQGLAVVRDLLPGACAQAQGVVEEGSYVLANFNMAPRAPARSDEASEQERERLLELAGSSLRQHHLSRGDTAAFLKAAAPSARFLSAKPHTKGAPILLANLDDQHGSLLLIAETDGRGQYQISYEAYLRTNANKVTYFARVDLDQDGQDELIFQSRKGGAVAYHVMSKKTGKWTMLLSSAGCQQ